MSIRATHAISPKDWQTSVGIHIYSYCLEWGYEDVKKHKDPKAFDSHDYFQAMRALIWLRNQAVASVRILIPGKLQLPALSLLKSSSQDIDTIEISGFCSSVSNLQLSRREKKHVTNVLCGAALALAHEYMAEKALPDVQLMMVITESMATLLKKSFGVHLTKASDQAFEHHTKIRYVYYGNLKSGILPTMEKENPKAFEIAQGNNLQNFFKNSTEIMKEVA